MYWVFIAYSNSWKVESAVGLYLNSRERVELQPVSNSRVETKDRPEYSTDDEASPSVPSSKYCSPGSRKHWTILGSKGF